MKTATILRRTALTVAICAVCLLIAGAALIGSLNTGYLQRPLLHWLAMRAGRSVTVAGAMHFQLWSMHPRIDAEGVTIGNPSWSPPGWLAEVDHLTVILRLPTWHRSFEIERMELQGATVHLLRDDTGRANWQPAYPPQSAGANGVLIRSLLVPAARVTLQDDRRHLQFRGVLSIGERPQAGGEKLLALRGGGILNDRPMGLDILGESLHGAVRGSRYKFTFDERSGGSRLYGRGELPQAFDFAVMDADYEALGPDLRDLYYLTGVHLIDTGSYRLTGHVARRGLHTTFSKLAVSSGESDMHGSVSVDASAARRRLSIDLRSHLLRLADVGKHSAPQRGEAVAEPALLLPTTPLNLAAIRKADVSVDFQADRMLAGHAVLESVIGKMTMEKGTIDVSSLHGHVLDGQFAASLQVDAGLDQPPARFKLDLSDVHLQRWLEGTLQVHLQLDGHGTSVHAVAANATGMATASVGPGSIRKALAEIAGVDLRGLGLMLSRSTQDTQVRCGRARFDVSNGVLTVGEALMDTDPVVITGSGVIDFGPETLDLSLFGRPKSLRLLRLEAPIRVSGTLRKPVVALQTHGAKLKLIDRGSGAVPDCAR